MDNGNKKIALGSLIGIIVLAAFGLTVWLFVKNNQPVCNLRETTPEAPKDFTKVKIVSSERNLVSFDGYLEYTKIDVELKEKFMPLSLDSIQVVDFLDKSHGLNLAADCATLSFDVTTGPKSSKVDSIGVSLVTGNNEFKSCKISNPYMIYENEKHCRIQKLMKLDCVNQANGVQVAVLNINYLEFEFNAKKANEFSNNPDDLCQRKSSPAIKEEMK